MHFNYILTVNEAIYFDGKVWSKFNTTVSILDGSKKLLIPHA